MAYPSSEKSSASPDSDSNPDSDHGLASPDLAYTSFETGTMTPNPDSDPPAKEVRAKRSRKAPRRGRISGGEDSEKRLRSEGTSYKTSSRDAMAMRSRRAPGRGRTSGGEDSEMHRITVVTPAEEMAISFVCSCGKEHQVMHRFEAE